MTSEPDMESLLASIRKAIDSDIGKNTKPPAPAAQDSSFRGAMREAIRIQKKNNERIEEE